MELAKLTGELTRSSPALATTPRSGPDLGVRREGEGVGLVPRRPMLLVGRFEFLRFLIGQFQGECLHGLR